MKNLNYIPKINHLFEKFQKALKSNKRETLHKILESIQSLENEFLEDYTNKKKEGVYFTKSVISNFICSETFILYLKERFKLNTVHKVKDLFKLSEDLQNRIATLLLKIKICDPACGSGVFLVSAIDLLYHIIKKIDFKSQLSTIGHKLIENIFGYDINDAAVKLTILKLCRWYYLNSKSDINQIFTILCSNIKKEDSLTSKIKKKFEIVVGNPPYGNILTKNQKFFLKNENIFYKDIYCAYILKAINWCNGIVGFLVPKSFLLRQSYINFRNNFLSNANLLKIIDVGPNLFKRATNEVQIIFYQKRIKEEDKLKIYEYPDKEIIVFKNQNFDKLKVCINSSCPFCDKTKKVFAYTFKNECPYCNSNTIPLNRIRIKSSLEINDIINKIELIGDLNYLNIKCFPRMIRGEESKGLRQIKQHIKHNILGSCLFLYAKDDFNYYYFKKNKSFNIELIDPKVLKGENYEYYIGPKLLIKHNSIVPQATFTEDNVCFTSSVYSLSCDNNLELKYICAILNSALMQFYCLFGINNQNNTTINLNQYMIRHLPIINENEELKIKISQKVDDIIENLLQAEGIINQQNLHNLRELDKWIFEAYEISEGEQKIIISEVKKNITFFKLIYSILK
ncbi:MAG: Eco57I restriction-modification methylase domain-containing protein [Promethearchaeota archaeon]